LSQFSRRANWLSKLFPASISPTTKDPGQRSDDVSLVQPYDASGWAFQDSNSWAKRTDVLTGATGFSILQVIDLDSIFRLLGMDTITLVDAKPSILPSVIDREGTGDQFFLAKQTVSSNGGLIFELNTPIIGPGSSIRIDWAGGDGNTQFTVGWYGVLAPLGTVFYL